MEVKDIRALMALFHLRDNSMTRTYIINMCVGLTVFLLIGGVANIAAAQTVPEDSIDQPTAINDRSKDRILALAENMSDKMRAAVRRHEQIANRLETRLEGLAAAGSDMAVATELLYSSRTTVANVSLEIESELGGMVDYTISAEDPRAAWAETRAAYAHSANTLRSAYADLEASVAAAEAALTTTNQAP